MAEEEAEEEQEEALKTRTLAMLVYGRRWWRDAVNYQGNMQAEAGKQTKNGSNEWSDDQREVAARFTADTHASLFAQVTTTAARTGHSSPSQSPPLPTTHKTKTAVRGREGKRVQRGCWAARMGTTSGTTRTRRSGQRAGRRV